MLPPIPPWDGVHPLVVHRPIALLLIVPLFVLAAAVLRRGRAGAATALTLVVLGLGAAFVATAYAAHDGGRLVHQHGVHALLNQDPQPLAAADPRMDDD